MKKKILAVITLLLYCLLFCMPAFAAEDEDLTAPAAPEQFIINADQFILSEEELGTLNNKAAEIYSTYNLAVFIARNDALEGEITQYAPEVFGTYGGGNEGMVLALTSSQWFIYKTARADAMIADELDEQLWNSFVSGTTDYECISAYLTALSDVLASKVIPDNRLLPRLVDEADILSSWEEEELLQMLDEISERQQFDVVIATVDSTNGKDIMDFADDYYDYNGFGFGEKHDGVALVVNMDTANWGMNREYWITTTGFGIRAITDAGINYIEEKFVSYLSDGDYYTGFEKFATLCDEFVTQAKTGDPYDNHNLPKDPVSWLWVPGSMLLGAAPAGVVTGNWKSKLKSIRSKRDADTYFDSGISRMAGGNSVFLYRNVNRVRIDTDSSSRSGGGSSTHFGSSGTSHGGGGGRF